MNLNFKRDFFKNVIISAGYSYSNQAISFISSMVTARLLLPENYGLVGLITVFSGFISIFLDSGISLAIIRSGYQRTYQEALHNLSFWIGLMLCFITLLFVYPISEFYNNKNIILPGVALSFLFIIKAINLVPLALLSKHMRFGERGQVDIYSNLGAILTTIVLAYFKFEHWAIIWGQYASALVSIYLINRHSELKFRLFKWPLIIKGYHISKTLIGSLVGFNIVNYWARNADNLLVGKFYGASDLGIYNRAYIMLTLPLNLITGIFSNVLLPSLVKLKRSGGSVAQEYFFVLKIISIINVPIGILLIGFPIQFVELLWGKNWLPVANLLPYFGLLVMTQTLLSTTGNLLVLEGKERVLMYAGWICSSIIVCGIVIGAFISLEAIAAFYALAYITGVLVYNAYFIYHRALLYSLRWVFRFWFPKILISVGLWLGIYYKNHTLVFVGLILWLFFIAIDTAHDFRKVYILFLNKIKR